MSDIDITLQTLVGKTIANAQYISEDGGYTSKYRVDFSDGTSLILTATTDFDSYAGIELDYGRFVAKEVFVNE